MLSRKKVIVGLSGGVDSSAAAFILKEQGYDVTGVTMSIWGQGFNSVPTGKHSCYGPDEMEEIREAKEVAEKLGIPFRVFDCSKKYKLQVLDYFRNEYLSGRTPNPCVKCNQLIKFGMLPDVAKQEGVDFDFFATGHYARAEWNDDLKRHILLKALDPKKDQTYFLYRLSQEQLSKVIFPLGGMTKKDVRAIAAKIDLALSEKDESQDFYSGDYKELLEVPELEGNIINSSGKVLGSHKGIWNYTIGQRKGLGIAWSEPLYVIGLDQEKNNVVVGTRDEILSSSFIVNELNWIAFEKLDKRIGITAKIRSATTEKEAEVEPYGEGKARVTFLQPNDSITPGQSAVFYSGDMCIGGGTIESVIK